MTPRGGPSAERPGDADGARATGAREPAWLAELATGRIPTRRDDRTTPLYPTQRGRDAVRHGVRPGAAHPTGDTSPAGPVSPSGPVSAARPVSPAGALTAALPALGLPDAPGPGDRTAPLPRTGEEPLAAGPGWAGPVARGAEGDEDDAAHDGGAGHEGDAPDGEPIDEPETPADRYGEPDPEAAAGWELVRATQDGDAEAFGALFDRYHDIVFRFVLYRLGDRHLAEDLTQETFMRAYRRIGSVSYQGRDIGAWFVTIARNLVLDHVKSGRYRLESTIGEVTEVVPDRGRPGPEGEVVAGLVHAELLRCVQRLGDDQRECIDLRFLRGLSVSETAAAMDRNEGAVKALQHRAVRRLAQLLPEGLQ